MDKIGVFLCTGCDIGKAVDLEPIRALCAKAHTVAFSTHACLCAPEGVALIEGSITRGEVDGVVIAACSQRAKTKELDFSAHPAVVSRVALREQVAWSQTPGAPETQAVAEDLVRMGIARVAKSVISAPKKYELERTVLVVGGGLAGLSAAKAAVGLGHSVVLLERTTELGGFMRTLPACVPEAPPYDRLHENTIEALAREVMHTPDVRVIYADPIRRISGQPGQLAVELESGVTFKVGAIVQATGAKAYDATKLTHLGFGASPDVITTAMLDEMLCERTLVRPSDRARPRLVAFVQCAGSRDSAHLPYCSAECCGHTLRQLMAIAAAYPDVECAVLYRDMRTPGELERFYLAAQEQSRAMFLRATVTRVAPDGDHGLVLELADSLLSQMNRVEADLVVLATGMVPQSADGEALRELFDARVRLERRESDAQVATANDTIARLQPHQGTEVLHLQYRQGPDLPTLRYRFADSHFICFPYETRRTGIYAAGAVRAPMEPALAAEDGFGAAMKAVQCLAAAARGVAVEPWSDARGEADFFLQRCTQCKRCTEECPFGTLDEDVKGTPQYQPLRCRRCGICLGACPERIVSFPDYSVLAVAEMIKAIEIPDAEDELPRLLAFVCENDALPALDVAAASGLGWSPHLRVIPVRCLGAVNIVWIADALSRGIDGVLLLGCKRGDDYQCHAMRGSELAHTRMGNVQETLKRLALESERIKICEIGRDESARVPELFAEFVAAIAAIPPNPYKGW